MAGYSQNDDLAAMLIAIGETYRNELDNISLAEAWPPLLRMIVALNDAGATASVNGLVDQLMRTVTDTRARLAACDALEDG
jgi:hypothetical protein